MSLETRIFGKAKTCKIHSHANTHMRYKSFSLILVASIAFLGISGCSSGKPAVSTTDQKTSSETNSQSTQKIQVVGAGSTYPLLKSLAAAYEAKVGTAKLDFLPEAQSASAIKAAANQLADMGGVTRKLKPEEDNGQLQHREIARDMLVVATHSSVTGVTNLTTDDLKAIYSGAIKNWKELGGPDAAIVVLDRPEDESAKQLLREHYLGKNLEILPDAVVLKQEIDLIQTLKDTPYSIGTFSLGYAISNNLNVNRLNLDGIAPTPENLLSGKYQMARKIGIVSDKTPSTATQGFIDFLSSPEAVKVMQEFGVVPSAKP